MEKFTDIFFGIATIVISIFAIVAKKKDKGSRSFTKSVDMTPWPDIPESDDELVEEGVRSTSSAKPKSSFNDNILTSPEEEQVGKKNDKLKIDKKKLIIYSEIMKQKF